MASASLRMGSTPRAQHPLPCGVGRVAGPGLLSSKVKQRLPPDRSIGFHLSVLAILAWGLAGRLESRPFRVDLIPNGHTFGCGTCHLSGGGTLRNQFGSAVEEAITPSGEFWNDVLAALDSDGDGFSNGQELGDPDGDGLPDPFAPVSHPGDPLSFPITVPNLSWVGTVPDGTRWPWETTFAQVRAADPQGIQFLLFEWTGPEGRIDPRFTVLDRVPPYASNWKLPPGKWRLDVSALDGKGARGVLAPVFVEVIVPKPMLLSLPRRALGNPGRWGVSWTGGVGPFQIQRAARMSDGRVIWTDWARTSGTSHTWLQEDSTIFIRLVDLGQP